MSNASDRPPLPYDRVTTVPVFQTSDFGVPEPAPDGQMRVKLADNVEYRCHGTIFLPLFWVPKAMAPGQFTVISFTKATLLVDGSAIPTFWGREISALAFDKISVIDISNGGQGRGSVLMDLVGGNGSLSNIVMAKCTFALFKRIATLVDIAMSIGEATQDVGCEQGWVARRNPGTLTAHFIADRQFTGIAAAPPNSGSSVSILGDTPAVSITGNSVQLGRPENSLLHIDSGTTTGSYTVSGQNWVGPSQGQFFRPDISDSITAQSDVSISVSSFVDSAVAPGVDTQVNMGAIIDLTRGQGIAISGGTYAGTYSIVRVADDQSSFDIAFSFAGASAGTLALTEHTVAACTFVRDETVTVSGTVSYNGTFKIVSKTDTAFVLPQPFVIDDAAGIADSSGRDQTSPGVGATANGAQEDSAAEIEICWNGHVGATTVADGSYSVLALSGVMEASKERFTLSNAATGEVTYNGVRPARLHLIASVQALKAGASLASYRLAVSVNQGLPVFLSAPYTTLDLRDTTQPALVQALVTLQPGDDLRVMIAGDGTTTAPTIVEGTIIIS